MWQKYRSYISLSLWLISLLGIGGSIGTVTKIDVDTWYTTLNRSSLTAPNYVFPLVWTILYMMIAISGWLIWEKTPSFANSTRIKGLYILQLLLNWSWTPLFFYAHAVGSALLCITLIDLCVALFIKVAYATELKLVSILMMPYLAWLLFATYLNFYIWLYN
jgi:tryptophan-rich sensory protein